MPHRWNTAARDRRRQIESGADITFCRVLRPLLIGRISKLAPHTLLEVGCGSGHLSLAASQLVPSITALEPSHGMHSEAQEVLRGTGAKVLNVRIEDFDTGTFDVVLSHLCLQTTAQPEAFLQACERRLHPSGVLLFSIPHPCFFNDYKKLIPLESYSYSSIIDTEISFSITSEPHLVFEGVPYHHRPLSRYFQMIAQAGLVARDFLEPWPAPEIQALYGQPWSTPRYCVFECARRAG